MPGLVANSSISSRDELLQSPWINLVEEGVVSQIFYDDVQSLPIKYRMAAAQGLRGVGLWTANMLDYGPAPFNDSTLIPQATRDMWQAISTVPFTTDDAGAAAPVAAGGEK